MPLLGPGRRAPRTAVRAPGGLLLVAVAGRVAHAGAVAVRLEGERARIPGPAVVLRQDGVQVRRPRRQLAHIGAAAVQVLKLCAPGGMLAVSRLCSAGMTTLVWRPCRAPWCFLRFRLSGTA